MNDISSKIEQNITDIATEKLKSIKEDATNSISKEEEFNNYFSDKGKFSPSSFEAKEVNTLINNELSSQSVDVFKADIKDLSFKIGTFMTMSAASAFPDKTLRVGIYNTLKDRLEALHVMKPLLFSTWYNKGYNAQLVEDFRKLENPLSEEAGPSNSQEPLDIKGKGKSVHYSPTGSDTSILTDKTERSPHMSPDSKFKKDLEQDLLSPGAQQSTGSYAIDNDQIAEYNRAMNRQIF